MSISLRLRVVGDPWKLSAQLNRSRQLPLPMEDSANRIGISLGDNKHPKNMPMGSSLGKREVFAIPGAADTLPSSKRGGVLMSATTTDRPTVRVPKAEPTIGASTYIKPQDMQWQATQFPGISVKVLYEDKSKGEMTCLLKWDAGATLPMHKHPELEQSYVIEGSFSDHDGICRAGEYVWRRSGSFHETHSSEGAVILAIYRKPNIFQNSAGYDRQHD